MNRQLIKTSLLILTIGVLITFGFIVFKFEWPPEIAIQQLPFVHPVIEEEPLCGEDDDICLSGCTHQEDPDCTYCGDSIIQTPNDEGITEVCDGTSLKGEICITQGYPSGTLSCSSDCFVFNATNCTPPPPPNEPPELNPIGDKTIDENQQLTFTITATDPDNDTLYYSVQNRPPGSTFQDQTFIWTPNYDQSGIYNLTFIVSDSKLTDSETITITVENISTCGDIDDICLSGCTHSQDSDCTYCGDNIIQTPNDEGITEVCDGTSLKDQTCQTKGYTGGTLFCSSDCITFNTDNCLVSWEGGGGTPSGEEEEEEEEEPTNSPPILNPIGNKTTNENQTLSFTVSATDPDNDTLTYSIQGLVSGVTFNPATRIFNWTSTYDQSGTYNFTFIVSDSELTDSETITITVQDVCMPDTCQGLGYECGTHDDGCGGTSNCGTCQTGYTCTSGQCVQTAQCGDGQCNGTETCSTCPQDCGTCLTGNTYYLDAVNGDDSNLGTSDAPWKTLDKAQSSVTDGDTVKLRNGNYGSYVEPVGCDFGYDDWVTYEADTGHTPVFTGISAYGHCQPAPMEKLNSGTLLKAHWIFRGITVYHGGAYLRELSYVQFYNCTFIGDGFVFGVDDYAISLHTVSDIVIDGCTINGDGEGQGEGLSNGGIPKADFGKGYANGIRFQGPARDITINNCDIGSCNSGISAVHDSGIVISNNEIHHATDGITTHLCNTAASGLTDPIVIEYNHIHTLYEYGATLENPDGGWHSDGIQFFDLEINHVVIRGNHIHYSDGDGMFLKGSKTATGNTDWLIENNLVYDVFRPDTSSETAASVMMYNCDDATFRNNTILGKGKVEAAVEGTPPTPMTFAVFSNNIIRRINLGTDTGSQGTIVTHEDNNIINIVEPYGMGEFVWGPNTVILSTDSQYRALFNNFNANDFTLASDSIAIDFGNSSYAPITDILGNPRVRAPDAGAYEYQGTPQQCISGQTQSCSTGLQGICSSGTKTCQAGIWGSCVQNNQPTTENCTDLLDNDCDGTTDCLDSDCSADPVCQTGIPTDYISFWKFDGNANDEKGINNGTIQGNPQFVSGVQGQALSFDGDGDYVDVGKQQSLNNLHYGSFTISMWLYDKKPYNGGWDGLFYGGDVNTYLSRIGNGPDYNRRLYWSVALNPTSASASVATNQNTWIYFVGIYSNVTKTVSIYINGEEAQYYSYSAGSGAPYYSDSSFNKTIGYDPSHQYMFGLIDNVMIYNRALSASEVQNIYNAQKLGAAPARISQTDDLTDEKLNNLASILSSIRSAIRDILNKIRSLF